MNLPPEGVRRNAGGGDRYFLPSGRCKSLQGAPPSGNMQSLYLFSLLVGGILLLVAAFGSGHDHHQGLGDHAHADPNAAAKLLSLRTLTYFLFVFGGVGAALSWGWTGASSLLVFPVALVAGLCVGGLVGYTFRYLARTESGALGGEESFVGLQGRMVVPIAEGGVGKILVRRGDRSFELTARPLDSAGADRSTWKSIVVVEMKRGIAIIAPIDDPVLTQGS